MKDINIIFYANMMIGSGVILTASVTFVWVIKSLKKQKSIFRDLKYRKKHGLFDPEQYYNSDHRLAVKNIKWLKQQNEGLEPSIFDQKIKFIDNFGKIENFTLKRR